MYYIEGIIDSLDILHTGKGEIKFSLIPEARFIQIVSEGKKKALFIESETSRNGLLVPVSKNEKEKEVLWFSLKCENISINCALLTMKNNRNIIRVEIEDSTCDSPLYIWPSSPSSSISAKTIRVL